VMHALARFASTDSAFADFGGVESHLAMVPGQSPSPVGGHVVILDGDEAVRRMARVVIEPMGYTCYEAQDGLTAMDLINDFPIDLILVDVMLREMNGYD